MVSPINTSLSGLNAASKRIEVASNNIANQNTTKTIENGQATDKPFTPQRVDLVSLSNAGVEAQVRAKEPATTQLSDGQGGTFEAPNVDQAQELVEIKMATYDFKANIKAIQVQDNTEKALLNIIS